VEEVGRGRRQGRALPQGDVPRGPAPARAQAAGGFQPREEGVGDEGVAAVMEGVPVARRDARQRVEDARGGHARRPPAQPSLSRNRSASSAAMHPNPAEVIACRYTWSATSPAANTPLTEVSVAPPDRPERISM